jgi:FecR protein
MTRLGRKLVLGAAVLAIAFGGVATAQNAAVGVASSVVKDVRFTNAATPKPKAVALKQRIALGDLIQTGKGAQLQLLLLDRSSFSIGSNATIRIDRFVYDPARGRGSGATVTRGAFRFMSGAPSRGNSSSVSTPVATIGIRGTIVEGAVGEVARDISKKEIDAVKDSRPDKDEATLVVLRGPGARTEGGLTVGAASVTSGGVTVELTSPGQATFVPRAGAAPIGPFKLSPEGLLKLQDQIYPRTAPGGGGLGKALLGGLLIAVPAVLLTTDGDRQPDAPPQSPAGSPNGP